MSISELLGTGKVEKAKFSSPDSSPDSSSLKLEWEDFQKLCAAGLDL